MSQGCTAWLSPNRGSAALMDAGISEGRPRFNPLEAAGPAYDTRNYRCRISGLLLVDLAPRAGQLQLCAGERPNLIRIDTEAVMARGCSSAVLGAKGFAPSTFIPFCTIFTILNNFFVNYS